MQKFILAAVALVGLLGTGAAAQAAGPYSLTVGVGYGSSSYYNDYNRGSNWGGSHHHNSGYGSSYGGRYDYDRYTNRDNYGYGSGSYYGNSSYGSRYDRDCGPSYKSGSYNSGWSGYGSASSYNHHHHSPSRW